jgi:hypothetical protein
MSNVDGEWRMEDGGWKIDQPFLNPEGMILL